MPSRYLLASVLARLLPLSLCHPKNTSRMANNNTRKRNTSHQADRRQRPWHPPPRVLMTLRRVLASPRSPRRRPAFRTPTMRNTPLPPNNNKPPRPSIQNGSRTCKKKIDIVVPFICYFKIKCKIHQRFIRPTKPSAVKSDELVYFDCTIILRRIRAAQCFACPLHSYINTERYISRNGELAVHTKSASA
jgi:hypothetical protein